MNFDISSSKENVARQKRTIAELLLDFSPNQRVAWPNRAAALAEVDESLHEDKRRISALTVYLGAHDHLCATSLGGVNLFPGVLDHAKNIRNLKGHQYEFYQRCG